MTLQSQRTIGLTRLILTLILLTTASVGASAQTNTFPTTGNAGVGTTTPATALEVRGSAVTSRVTTTGTTGANGKFQLFSADITNNPFAEMQLFAPTGAGSEYLRFNIGNSSGNVLGDVLTISRLGNVGIGTALPGARFHVSAGDSSFALFGPNATWGGSLAVGSGADFVSPISGRAQVLSSNGNLHLDAGTNQSVYIGWLTPTNTIINAQGGNVGIGTSSPSDLLQIDSAAGWGFRIRYTGNGSYLRLSSNQISAFTSGGSASDFYLNTTGGNVGIGTINPTKKLHVAGDIQVDGNINTKYQDLAEWVPSSEKLTAGTVVVLDITQSNQVVASGHAYDTRVAGVISTQPGITLGEGGEGKVLVATTGRVRVKVDASRGPIQIGDLLVTSDVPGVAMKSEAVEFAGRKMHMPGTIIGKALEPLAKGTGEILVLLSLQ